LQIVKGPDFGSQIKYSLKALLTKNGSMAAKLKSTAENWLSKFMAFFSPRQMPIDHFHPFGFIHLIITSFSVMYRGPNRGYPV